MFWEERIVGEWLKWLQNSTLGCNSNNVYWNDTSITQNARPMVLQIIHLELNCCRFVFLIKRRISYCSPVEPSGPRADVHHLQYAESFSRDLYSVTFILYHSECLDTGKTEEFHTCTCWPIILLCGLCSSTRNITTTRLQSGVWEWSCAISAGATPRHGWAGLAPDGTPHVLVDVATFGPAVVAHSVNLHGPRLHLTQGEGHYSQITYTYTQAHARTYARTDKHMHGCVHIKAHIPMHTHIRMHTWIPAYTHLYVHTHTHARIRTHTHTHTHSYKHTFVHTHTHTFVHTHTLEPLQEEYICFIYILLFSP